MLFWTVILLLFFTVLLFFATRGALPAVELPEPETYTADGQTLQAYPQYSLARGSQDPVFPLVRAYWRLRDDVVTWEAADGLLLQLTGLHSLPGDGDFAVTALARYGDLAVVSLEREQGAGGPQNAQFSNSYVEIKLFPACRLEDMPWYGEAGHVCDDADMHYRVLENSGGRLILREQNDGWVNEGGVLIGLSEARQLGEDVVYIVHRLNSYTWQLGHSSFPNLDPAQDAQQRSLLQELLDALFDGCLHLYRGLPEETLAAVLPDRLLDFPVAEASSNGGFALPCDRLLDMADTEEGISRMRLLGPGPEGETVLYTLENGGTAYLAGDRSRYTSWRDAFTAGSKTPDGVLSAFLGCPAVAYNAGWLLNPGTFYNPNTDSPVQNYYYLTMEPWAP